MTECDVEVISSVTVAIMLLSNQLFQSYLGLGLSRESLILESEFSALSS